MLLLLLFIEVQLTVWIQWRIISLDYCLNALFACFASITKSQVIEKKMLI